MHDRRHDVKVFGTYTVPFWDLRVSGTYRFTSGGPFARVVTSFPPETQTFAIYAEPVGAYQEPAFSRADLRVEKTVRVQSVRLGLYGDLYNVTNRVVVAPRQQHVGLGLRPAPLV